MVAQLSSTRKTHTPARVSVYNAIDNLINREEFINLAIGDPKAIADKSIVNTILRAIQKRPISYTHDSGIRSLKDAIVDYYTNIHGVDRLTNDHICVTPGSTNGLFCSIKAMIDHSTEEVIIEKPYYLAYPDQINIAGGKVKYVESVYDVGKLKSSVNTSTKAILVCRPNNPTGAVSDLSKLEKLLDFAEDRGIKVIVDEIYDSIVFDKEFYSALRLINYLSSGTLVLVSGVSKIFGLTGLRLGYTVSSPEVQDNISSISRIVNSSNNYISQHAATTAFRLRDKIFKPLLVNYSNSRAAYLDAINDSGVSFTYPDGAFYSLITITNAERIVKNSGYSSLAELITRDLLVGVMPGEDFGADNCIRISFCNMPDLVYEGTARIVKYLEANR